VTVPLKLLLDLKDEFCLTYLFITHDLATAKFMCDRVGILYLGQLVEVGEVRRGRRPRRAYGVLAGDAATQQGGGAPGRGRASRGSKRPAAPGKFVLETKEDPARRTLIIPNRPAVRRLLDAERDQGTPLAKAIEVVDVGEKTIEVRFRPFADVPDRQIDGRRVRCLRASIPA